MFSGCPYIYGDIERARQFSQQGLIDNLEYLNRTYSKAYIFQGIVDPIVPWRKTYYNITKHINYLNNIHWVCVVANYWKVIYSKIAQGSRIHNMYKEVMGAEQIQEKSDLLATHGFVRNFKKIKHIGVCNFYDF